MTITQPAIKWSKLTVETWCEMYLNITNKDNNARRRYGVFIVNCEHISHHVLLFLLLTLNM